MGTQPGGAATGALPAAPPAPEQGAPPTPATSPVPAPLPLPAAAESPPPAEAAPPPAPAPSTSAPAASPPLAAREGGAAAEAPPPAPRPRPARLTGTAAQLASAASLRARGRAEAALRVYGEVLAKEPDNADALAGRGLCYFDQGQTAKAEKALKAALERDASHPDALLGLAETYRYVSRRKDAVAYYERYLDAHPKGAGADGARTALEALKE